MRALNQILLWVCTLAILLPFAGPSQAAETYPAKPIVFIVPLEAGAAGDILSRKLVQKASAVLGAPIAVVNKPGAGSTIGYREVYNAAPNGYTIGMATATIITSKLQGLMPFDYHDFTMLGTFYGVYLNVWGSTKTNRPFKTIEEVIAFAKAHPGEVSIAAGGVGQNDWIGAMAFVSATGINLNIIPQAGTDAVALAQLAGGHADLAITPLVSARSQIEGGFVRFLAVLGPQRVPYDKSVPTLKEIGYDVGWESPGNVIGPPKMPKEIVDKLAKAFEIAANDPEYRQFLQEQYVTPLYVPPEKIVPYMDVRRNVAREIMSKAGILKEK
jgi:tripartite-type tricarboxylate transporter receptor subunit TctC